MTIRDLFSVDATDSQDVCKFAAAALGRYDIRRPSFNLAANSERVTPENRTFFIYPEGAHGLVSASMAALQEYQESGSVTRATRERFVIEDTKDRLQSLQGHMGATEYRDLHEKVMGRLNAKMTGMESLVFSGASAPKDHFKR